MRQRGCGGSTATVLWRLSARTARGWEPVSGGDGSTLPAPGRPLHRSSKCCGLRTHCTTSPRTPPAPWISTPAWPGRGQRSVLPLFFLLRFLLLLLPRFLLLLLGTHPNHHTTTTTVTTATLPACRSILFRWREAAPRAPPEPNGQPSFDVRRGSIPFKRVWRVHHRGFWLPDCGAVCATCGLGGRPGQEHVLPCIDGVARGLPGPRHGRLNGTEGTGATQARCEWDASLIPLAWPPTRIVARPPEDEAPAP